MITISLNEYKQLPRELEKERERILAKMSRLSNLESSEELAFHYSFLRCSLDIVEFMLYYTSESHTHRNHLCVTTERPLTYKQLMETVNKTINNLLKKDPTSSERYNSVIFITLHLLNKIKFEE